MESKHSSFTKLCHPPKCIYPLQWQAHWQIHKYLACYPRYGTDHRKTWRVERTRCKKSAFKLRNNRKVRSLPVGPKERCLEKRQREASLLGFVLWHFCRPSLCINAATSSWPYGFGWCHDTDDYTRNLGETDLLDTDNVLNALLTQCVEVGQENCPWASNNTSADLALQLEDLLSTLAVSPLPASGPRGPTTITESQLATMIFSNFFMPMDGFPTIAKLVSELLQGNGTSFAAYKEQSLPMNSQPLLKAGSWSQVPTTTAIVCGDGDSLYNLPRSSFKSRLARFRAQSPIFADVRAPFQLSCVHWPVRPVSFLPFKDVPRVLKNSELKARG